MATKTQSVSKGFPIVAPYIGDCCLFKVYFGKKYLIWKGKSLLQSIDTLGNGIKAGVAKGIEDTHYLYYVCEHIKKTRCLRGTVEIISSNFLYKKSNGSIAINGFNLLKSEQIELDKAKEDELCLNNNEQAYVPNNTAYITDTQKNKFLNWYENRNIEQ